jgi:alpha-ketoglutarate-dependent 2,4-dichlorophenoxyacetate dioxygenase
MPELRFEPLHPDFGARVLGLDLTGPLSETDVAAIHAAVDEYQLLCFPDQAMSDAAHLALTRRLGEPEAEHVTLGATGEVVYFGTVGNVLDDGTKNPNAAAHTKYQKGNELWHSDSSFRAVPSYVSILHAYEVPDEGGATEFVSERAAYDRLSDAEKARFDSLLVLHDYVFSRSPIAPVNPNHAASLPPPLHPLVRRNPANGRRNLYIGSHARSVHEPDGTPWRGIDSRALLDDLVARATRPQDVYAHPWKAGDTVIWDNRCTLHRGAGYDADKYRRRMRQTRVVGTVPRKEPRGV